MINYLHGLIRRPEQGWDPVPKKHALNLAAEQWKRIEGKDLEGFADRLGGLRGKRLLDLGGGAGQYSIAFARQGASVVWHDISANYRDIVRQKAADHGLELECSLGYMEEASRFGKASFDIVFCCLCWYYCRGDRAFARLIFDLLKPGGIAFVDVPTSRGREAATRVRRVQALLYHVLGLKVGHPFPRPGRVPTLFAALAPSHIEVDFTSGKNERILLVK